MPESQNKKQVDPIYYYGKKPYYMSFGKRATKENKPEWRFEDIVQAKAKRILPK